MSNSQNDEIISFKIVMVGDASVGKSQFLNQFCNNKFDDDYLTSICVDQRKKFIKREDKKIELCIWDTAGQEKFRSIAKNLYKGADGILLMYDISNIQSFKNIKVWIHSIKESVDISKIALIVVGNNCHLNNEERVVNEDMKKVFEKIYNIKIIEASAKDNINVNESFIILVDKMIELGLGKKKSNNYDDNEENIGKKLEDLDKNRNKGNCFSSKGKKIK